MKEYSKILWAGPILISLTATSLALTTVFEDLLNEFINEDSRIIYLKVIIILYTFVNVVVLVKLPAPGGRALYFFLALARCC